MADRIGPVDPDSEDPPAADRVDGDPLIPAGPVVLVDYDERWPQRYQREADRISRLLGDQALLVEHVGSTAVPGLVAKPIIDINLTVADSTDEPAYLPALQAAGYRLVIREPDWYQHRMLKGPDADVNLHVFSAGCPEIERMRNFRDWLRTHNADRELYAGTKRELAARTWSSVQDYADAKAEVVTGILRRAAAAS